MRWREESEPHTEDDTARRSSSLDDDEADSSSPDGNFASPEKQHSPHHQRLEASSDRDDEGSMNGDTSRVVVADTDNEKQHKEIKEESDPPDLVSADDDDGADHAEEPPRVPWKPQTSQSTCEFTHTILNYAQQRESGCKKAEYSETTVDEYGNRWRLIIYVNGNGRASNHHLSLFLQVADADDLPFGWKKAVSYVLTLEHPKGGSYSYAKRNPDKTFKLCPKAIDWGWSQFITSDRIQQEGFVSNDSLTVRASVTVKSSSICIDEEDAELYLKCAVEEGDADAVKLCLDQGAQVNCKFKDDLYTPLHTACSSGTSKGSIEVLNLLLEMGADPNACNKWSETPLLIAANNGHFAACEALLEHGADPSLCSEAGWSALTFAAHKGYDDIVSLLLKKDAPVNTRVAEDNSTPLHKACAGAKPGHLSAVKLLVERDADVHALNKWRETPLLTAANHGQAESVKHLLDAGADPCKCTDTGWSPLSIAAYKGHDDVVRLLLEEGAPTEEEDPTLSALLQAATKGLPGTVDLLLKNGADHTVTTKKGDTALSILVEQNLIDAAVEMVSHYNASIPRCSRDRKKVQRARLLINLRMKQMEREGKHLSGSTDEDESDDDGSSGSRESQHDEANGAEITKARAKKKKDDTTEATDTLAAEEKARAAEEELLRELQLEAELAKREEAEANSKRAKKKKKKEQLRHQKLKEEEDRRQQEELKAKEREKVAQEREAKKRKELEAKEQQRREEEIKEMMEREKAMAAKRKERERRERLQSKQRSKEVVSASPSGSEGSVSRSSPPKVLTTDISTSSGSKKASQADPITFGKKSAPVGRKVAPLGGNRRWETKQQSAGTPLSANAEQSPSVSRTTISAQDHADASSLLAPRPGTLPANDTRPLSSNGVLHPQVSTKLEAPRESAPITHTLPPTQTSEGNLNGRYTVTTPRVEHPAVSLFRREKVFEVIRYGSTFAKVRPIALKRAVYRWCVRAAHENQPFTDSLIPSWKNVDNLVAHFQRQFIADGRRGSFPSAGETSMEVLKEAGTSMALMCQGLANDVVQFQLRIEGHLPRNWSDATIEMTCVESLGADGTSMASIAWANQYAVQLPSSTLATLRQRYQGPPGRFLTAVFTSKVWYESRDVVLTDSDLGLRVPILTLQCLAREAGVMAEIWSDPFSVQSQNMFWGNCQEIDRLFGGKGPFGTETSSSEDILLHQGGSVAVLPPLDSAIASLYMRRIVDILVMADCTGVPVSFALFLPADCFMDPTAADLSQLDPRLLDVAKLFVRHAEILHAGRHAYRCDGAPGASCISTAQSMFVLMQNNAGKARFNVSDRGVGAIIASLSIMSLDRFQNPVANQLPFEPSLTPQAVYFDSFTPVSPDPQRVGNAEFSSFGAPVGNKRFGNAFENHNRVSRHGRLFDLVDDVEDDPLGEVDLVSGMLNTLDVGLFQTGTLAPEVDIEAISLMGIGAPPSQSSRSGNAAPGRFG